jgi:leader peptidase (prepilin peptidase)/N-methyltransferase
MFEIFTAYPALFVISVALLGMIVGSFLNVVIHRLPIMLEREWRRDCQQFLGHDAEASDQTESEPRWNLIWPGSHCPHCAKPLAAHENIPLLSFLWLRGRCSACQSAISPRYPAVELLSALLSAVVAHRFGPEVQVLPALLLTWALLALSFIDAEHQLLPDAITLPMLWLGLLLSVFRVFTDSTAAILGAVAGYLSLWLVYQLFKWLTGREGMGYGDFKLLALLGAWLGWEHLPQIILLSSLVGAVAGLTLIALTRRDHRQPIPYGPYLAAAGWIALIWGDWINASYLGYMAPG